MGLKENVIVGRLIPAGTGAVMNRLRAIAAGRDQRTLWEETRPSDGGCAGEVVRREAERNAGRWCDAHRPVSGRAEPDINLFVEFA